MKRTIILMAACLGLSTAVVAQNELETGNVSTANVKKDKKNLSPEERAKKGANHAEKKLGLTAQQKSDWEIASLKRIMANEPLQEKLKGSTTPDERKSLHNEVKANNDAFEGTINALLTADQKTKFTALKEERKSAKKKQMKKKFDESDVDYGD